MRYLILLLLIIPFGIQAQIVGGAGVCHVNGDPNSIADLNSQDVRSNCYFAVDTSINTRIWYYNHDSPLNNRWQLINLSVTDSDTRIDSIYVQTDTLRFTIKNIISNTILATRTIPLASIAPIQSITGSAGINVTPSGTTFNIAPTNDLGAIEALNANGFLVRTGTDAFAARTITGSGFIAVANGIGSTANPAITLAQNGATNGQVIKWNGSAWAAAADAGVVPAATAYKNFTAAAAGGVGVGDYFYASIDNTMGAIPGSLIRRAY